MSDPEHNDYFAKTPESQTVLRQIGKKFYDQCRQYASIFDSRPLVAGLPEDSLGDPQDLIDFSSAPGKTAEYRNSKGNTCWVTQREGYQEILEFQIKNYNTDEDFPGDTWDTYLLNTKGDILVAQRRLFLEDFKSDKFPISTNAEELLHKIDTDFKPAPQADSI